jgi:protein-disulfide isomerase
MSTPTPPPTTPDPSSRRKRRAVERSTRRSGGPAPDSPPAGGPSLRVLGIGALIVGVVVVLAIVAIGSATSDESLDPVSLPETTVPAGLIAGRSLGDPAAPVHIDAFEDPQCPACGYFEENIEPLLIAGPIANGRVSLTFRDLPFIGQESVDAAIAMRVAEAMDGKFWDYKAAVFHNQHGENKGAFTVDRLADIAVLLGLDRATFLAEMEKPEYLQAIQAEAAVASGLGISSTPTLMINGQKISGVPTWEDLKTAIDDAAAAAAVATPAPSPLATGAAASPAAAAPTTGAPAATTIPASPAAAAPSVAAAATVASSLAP